MTKKIELQQPDLGKFFRAPTRPTTLVAPTPVHRGTPQPLPLVHRGPGVHTLTAGGSTPADVEACDGNETAYLSF